MKGVWLTVRAISFWRSCSLRNCFTIVSHPFTHNEKKASAYLNSPQILIGPARQTSEHPLGVLRALPRVGNVALESANAALVTAAARLLEVGAQLVDSLAHAAHAVDELPHVEVERVQKVARDRLLRVQAATKTPDARLELAGELAMELGRVESVSRGHLVLHRMGGGVGTDGGSEWLTLCAGSKPASSGSGLMACMALKRAWADEPGGAPDGPPATWS